MQFAEGGGIRERHLRCERTRANPSALFKLQQIAAVAEDWSFFQPLQKTFLFHASLLFLIFALILYYASKRRFFTSRKT